MRNKLLLLSIVMIIGVSGCSKEEDEVATFANLDQQQPKSVVNLTPEPSATTTTTTTTTTTDAQAAPQQAASASNAPVVSAEPTQMLPAAPQPVVPVDPTAQMVPPTQQTVVPIQPMQQAVPVTVQPVQGATVTSDGMHSVQTQTNMQPMMPVAASSSPAAMQMGTPAVQPEQASMAPAGRPMVVDDYSAASSPVVSQDSDGQM